MCQPNPSEIRYFKPILSSFKNCDFLSSPYREGVGTRKWSLKFRLDKTAENIKNVMFQPTCLNIQFLDLWRKKKASSGTSGRVAWASYHDDDPRDFGPGVAYTSRDSWPLAIIWMPLQWGRELSAPKPYQTVPLQISQQVTCLPLFLDQNDIYIWRFSHWVILVVCIY